MKVRIEVNSNLPEDEIVIRCRSVDERVRRLNNLIADELSTGQAITFYKDNQEFFFPLDNVLFFETEGEHIYAHTASDAYRIKFRLYELETLLPRTFTRAAKGAIVNISQVHSITRNLTASSLIKFQNSHKQVYVSRHYYGALRLRLNERSSYEA